MERKQIEGFFGKHKIKTGRLFSEGVSKEA
jgi:hypothetical protein